MVRMRNAMAWLMVLCWICAAAACNGGDEGMPDVVGQDREEAVAELEDFELTVTVEEQPSAEKRGVVVAQTPEAGADFPDDDKVTITVASAAVPTEDVVIGDTTAPDVVGLLLPRAEEVLREKGVPLRNITPESSDLPDMTVVSQNPAPGQPVTAGGVDLTVSESATVPVPTLVGSTEAEATAEIQKVGLQVGRVETSLEGQGAVGRVVEQSPDPGFVAPRNSPIRITVKQSGVQVPRVLNQTLTAASPALVKSGLSFSSSWVVNKTKREGTITRLDPGQGVMVPRGSTVKLTYTVPRRPRWATATARELAVFKEAAALSESTRIKPGAQKPVTNKPGVTPFKPGGS